MSVCNLPSTVSDIVMCQRHKGKKYFCFDWARATFREYNGPIKV